MYFPRALPGAPGLAAGYTLPNQQHVLPPHSATYQRLPPDANLTGQSSTEGGGVGAPGSPGSQQTGLPAGAASAAVSGGATFYGQHPYLASYGQQVPGLQVAASGSLAQGGLQVLGTGAGQQSQGAASAQGQALGSSAAAQAAAALQTAQAVAVAQAQAGGSTMTQFPPTTSLPPPYMAGTLGYMSPYPPFYGYPPPAALGPGPPIQTSPKGQGPEGCNLFIFHIPNDMTNLDIYNYFIRFGEVISARIMVEKHTGRSRGFGFVSYDNKKSAEAAIKAMNGFQLGHKRLKVQLKKDKTDGPLPGAGKQQSGRGRKNRRAEGPKGQSRLKEKQHSQGHKKDEAGARSKASSEDTVTEPEQSKQILNRENEENPEISVDDPNSVVMQKNTTKGQASDGIEGSEEVMPTKNSILKQVEEKESEVSALASGIETMYLLNEGDQPGTLPNG